jgi:hypothetical protein
VPLQLVEIENNFSIVDHKGDDRGQLSVSIFPENANGSEVVYLEASEDLLDQAINLRLRVKEAKDIPQLYSNDCFITYTFMDRTYESKVSPPAALRSQRSALTAGRRRVWCASRDVRRRPPTLFGTTSSSSRLTAWTSASARCCSTRPLSSR